METDRGTEKVELGDIKDIQRENVKKSKNKTIEVRLTIERVDFNSAKHTPDDRTAITIQELLDIGDGESRPYSIISLSKKTIGELARLALSGYKTYIPAHVTIQNKSAKEKDDGTIICHARIDIIE
ncbi:MAG: hypothetical protein WA063_07155 [Minisyncoccia bacterium]